MICPALLLREHVHAVFTLRRYTRVHTLLKIFRPGFCIAVRISPASVLFAFFSESTFTPILVYKMSGDSVRTPKILILKNCILSDIVPSCFSVYDRIPDFFEKAFETHSVFFHDSV